MPSIHSNPDEYSKESGLAPAVGLPLIVCSAAMDAVTWPYQLIFGVWPMWGEESLHMKPPEH